VAHAHTLELLAAERGYLVRFCRECEVIHLEVGPVTLRLSPDGLESLTHALSRASAQLHHAAPDEQTDRIEAPTLQN
jgi:hypothetical protein